VAEDGGNMELVILSPEGAVAPFLRSNVLGSELTGPAFDPSGTRLYVSSQRNPGRTYEVTGPFRTSTTPPPTTTTTLGTTTTTVPAAISLSARGSKVKGRQRVDLTWSGASTAQVTISRNGVVIATTANDGAHTDVIGATGGGTYTYRVCEAGGPVCSNDAVVTF
jgi:secreted PhoX family phosphatase